MGWLKVPVSLRSAKDERRYLRASEDGLFKPLMELDSLKEWHHWRVVNNEYPYSAVFSVHHMLIPKRAVTEDDLGPDEKLELEAILKEIEGEYDSRMINFPRNQSAKDHFHIHLLVFKSQRRVGRV